VACTSRLSASISSLYAGSTDYEIIEVIEDIRASPDPDTTIVAQLAEALAASGERLDPIGELTADVASTGGPSSLSTLLAPLYLCAWGAVVPKLGIPGRPAGGIDCLAQIPRYAPLLDRATVSSVLEKCGYAHFVADGTMAPLDGRVFFLRQRMGAQDVPALVAASLLAKKLAVGVRRAGLDVRVAPWGNFGRDWVGARRNADLFREVASLLGISAYPVLTDARFPYQPFLGRAESLVALDQVFRGEAAGDLARHADLCGCLAAAVLSDRAPLSPVTGETLRDIFNRNLESQGADPEGFDRLVKATVAAHRFTVRTRRSGFYRVSLAKVRDLFVNAQRSAAVEDMPFPDPLGAVLLRPNGSWVNAGDPVASVRGDDGTWASHNIEILNTLSETAEYPVGLGFEGAPDG